MLLSVTGHSDLHELASYLARTSRLDVNEAQRLIEEVLAFLNETPEAFVRRRHRALQVEGRTNTEIFEQLGAELPQRRFQAPAYSQRQLRRIVYG
jgi:hypothetical protein